MLLVVYAVLLSIAFIAQLVSIFTALELRTVVAREVPASESVNDLMEYGKSDWVTAKWDDLQESLHCCGGTTFNSGYLAYGSTPIGLNYSVPDSCCHTVTKGCGVNMLRYSFARICCFN